MKFVRYRTDEAVITCLVAKETPKKIHLIFLTPTVRLVKVNLTEQRYMTELTMIPVTKARLKGIKRHAKKHGQTIPKSCKEYLST